MIRIKNIAILFCQLFLLPVILSCDTYFSYSPYEATLPSRFHNTTQENLELISSLDARDSKPFKVVLISDTHYHFDQLFDAITDINNKDDIAFVIVSGDLSENGLLKEFILFHELMENLKVPYLTVIGNHDYLSNGELVYAQMFGLFNYTFDFNNVKFVMFDDVRWESEKEPDFNWFSDALVNHSGYDHVIPVSHIPPFDKQLVADAEGFHKMLVKNNVSISLHGHEHDYSLNEMYGDGIRYLTVSSPQKRTYSEISITATEISIQKIEF